MKIKRAGATFIVILLLLLMGCSLSVGTEPTPTPYLTPPPTIIPQVTATPTPTPSPTPVPTPTPVINKDLEVHFLDVGQADCILVQSNGESTLIDSGNEDDGSVILRYLREHGVSELRYLIGTHPHEDHIGSFDDVVYNFSVGAVFMPKVEHTTVYYEEALSALINKGYTVSQPSLNAEYTLGTSSFRVIAPVIIDEDDLNNSSLGIKLSCEDVDFVLCGDAESEEELKVVNSVRGLDAEVLKLGHHGSSTSTSDVFLNAVNPQYAVISVGKDNGYGHPDADVLEKLENKGIKVFRTDKQGTIVCKTDGVNIEWNVSPWVYEDTGSVGVVVPPVGNTAQSTQSDSTQSAQTYVLNKNTMKFHYPSCKSVPKIKEKNREDFVGTRDEVISRGFDPCGICHP